MPRVQFEIPEELFERALPYIKKRKLLGVFGAMAFEEWINRKEARNRRAENESNEKLKRLIREVMEEMENE